MSLPGFSTQGSLFSTAALGASLFPEDDRYRRFAKLVYPCLVRVRPKLEKAYSPDTGRTAIEPVFLLECACSSTWMAFPTDRLSTGFGTMPAGTSPSTASLGMIDFIPARCRVSVNALKSTDWLRWAFRRFSTLGTADHFQGESGKTCLHLNAPAPGRTLPAGSSTPGL